MVVERVDVWSGSWFFSAGLEFPLVLRMLLGNDRSGT